MSGALRGFRVLEFGHYIVGQVLGMLLADQGAEVIKVEPPEDDGLRDNPAFAVWNRNKKSIILDLNESSDVRLAEQLTEYSDVLIDDSLDLRRVLSAERCQELNPRLIHVSLPAFPPEHSNHGLPPLEPIIAAMSGVYADRGEGEPSFISVPHASIFGAMTTAPAIVAALLHREATGEGQNIVVPLFDAMFTAMGANLVELPVDVPPAHPVIARFYQCKDGRWLNFNAGYPRSLVPMVTALGHPEWAEPLLDIEGIAQHPEDQLIWSDRVTSKLKERPAAEWEQIMEDAGVPCTMCRTIDEWLENEHAWASGAVISVDDPVYGPMRQVGIQVRMDETGGGVHSPAPALGQHTDEILAELR